MKLFVCGGYNCIALLLGWGGKTAINCFVLITGWFMCKQEFKWRKLLKLYLEVKLYRLVIYLIFLISGYDSFALKEFYKMIFEVAFYLGKGFTSSFIAFYALIPFINKLIGVLNRKEHKRLVIALITVFSIIPTLFLNGFYEYISWYVTLYLLAAYLRLYPARIFDNKRITRYASIITLLLSWASVGVIYYTAVYFKQSLPWYWFVADSNKILALATSVAVFCFFKNISLGQNRFINTVASSTFGVLLIHASSDTMRRWLWQDVCKNVWHFQNDSLCGFILHAFTCTIAVFSACASIDLIRQFIQKKISGFILCLNKKQSQ